jgi:formate hydrogenlyase subunit 3/multisubunit Na+/H+ antiporter MnhD subunit
MNGAYNLIFIPLLAGILLFLVPARTRYVRETVALLTLLATGYYSILLYGKEAAMLHPGSLYEFITVSGISLQGAQDYLQLRIDPLSQLIILITGLTGWLVLLYSFTGIRESIRNFYPLYLITLGASFGVVLSDNLLVFMIFWGVLGITLYKLIPGDHDAGAAAAKKALIIIGASDGIMILGIAVIWKITGSLSMTAILLPTKGILAITAFLALIIGSFAKAGAFPFHTWVPDYAEHAPAITSAFLPASLDKLLGIYLLARITTNLFTLTDPVRIMLLTLGTISILSAVMMALVQHRYKRLLGFHAVSQVGYMILGFGLGTQIGVAAGLFHMVNNVLYKSGLFLTAGNVEFRTGKVDIDDLGGLSRSMPVTFFSALILALSISGIPPFNGFASKWMIYQGIIDFGTGNGLANRLWIVWLSLAVFGSALTLASFIKFTGGIFLNRQKPEFSNIREVAAPMWVPVLLLSILCMVFGIFSTRTIVPELFMPVAGKFSMTGFWNSSLVSLLVLASIILGIMLYLISGIRKFRTADSFIGGEIDYEKTGYPLTGYYQTLREFKPLSWFYKKAGEGWFDIYERSKQATLWFNRLLGNAHSGILPVYVIWILAGLIIMLFLMI